MVVSCSAAGETARRHVSAVHHSIRCRARNMWYERNIRPIRAQSHSIASTHAIRTARRTTSARRPARPVVGRSVLTHGAGRTARHCARPVRSPALGETRRGLIDSNSQVILTVVQGLSAPRMPPPVWIGEHYGGTNSSVVDRTSGLRKTSL